MHASAGGWRPAFIKGVAENQPELCSLVEKCWFELAHFRPNFDEIVDTLEDLRPLESTKSAGPIERVKSSLLSAEDAERIRAHFNSSPKRFSAFLSHHNAACAAEARLMKDRIDSMLKKEAFLDSDNLRDLRTLVKH